MIVCHCKVVSDRAIREAAASGLAGLGAVCRATGAGSVCGGCVPGIRTLLQSAGTGLHAEHVTSMAARLATLREAGRSLAASRALETTHAAA